MVKVNRKITASAQIAQANKKKTAAEKGVGDGQ